MRKSIKTISKFNPIILYMEREIVLSSYSFKDQGSNKPSEFVTKFTSHIHLDNNKEYVVGLNRIINMSFTWYNVNAGYNNQLIKYSKDNGVTFTNILFPTGVWNYTDLNQHIQEATVIQEDVKEEYLINLAFDATTFRVTITFKENYQQDLTHSNFHELVGFDKEIVKQTKAGPRVPNLSQDTDILNIHCDLVNDSLVHGKDFNVIYIFSTSVLRPSYSFTLEPKRVT